MTKKLPRLMLLSAIFCTLLAVGSFTTANAAHAATQLPHVSQSPALSRVGCGPIGSGQVDIATDYNPTTGSTDMDCFSGLGEQYVNLYNVLYMYTGVYTVYWTWVDCNGATHYSVKGPNTYVAASNSPGGFAGYNVMCDIVYLAFD
jgi:hypothetical protein